MPLTQRRKEGKFYFAVEQHSPDLPGAEVDISVFFSHEGDGVPLLRRVLYFDEQTEEHVDNFCRAFAHNEHYRKICLTETAHWCRVAHLYEINAGIMCDDEDFTPQELEKRSEQLFHILRRDITEIENHPLYTKEMARISKREETALSRTLGLLTSVPRVQIASACQGSSLLEMNDLQIFLPYCHEPHAVIHFTSLPPTFLQYLQSGPLGQQHIALFEPNGIRALRVVHNRSFISLLTNTTFSYLKKHRLLRPSTLV
ncbi:hypothetical protein [Desulfosediminicola flagellatus]|uniref:hypothetical protein n=1 Tax=Desulfosediminicola flagellatus TaxID=2569541 RepID=UPI0010ABB055|nr:hypothetical protein [Desulfosediminicola flagellatus]